MMVANLHRFPHTEAGKIDPLNTSDDPRVCRHEHSATNRPAFGQGSLHLRTVGAGIDSVNCASDRRHHRTPLTSWIEAVVPPSGDNASFLLVP